MSRNKKNKKKQTFLEVRFHLILMVGLFLNLLPNQSTGANYCSIAGF